MASPTSTGPSLRTIPGELVVKTTTARMLLPSSAVNSWPPFIRVVETIANQTRQLPAHSHLGEEVLTYMIEGFASSQYEDRPAEPFPPGSVQLLSATSKVSHRISPSKGGTIRWFSLVLELPSPVSATPRLQTVQARELELQPDGSVTRNLVGPGSAIVARSGLVARDIRFVKDGTTFVRVGHGHRAVVYALAGRGAVDSQPIELGEATFAEGVAGLALHGQDGLRLLVATAPRAT